MQGKRRLAIRDSFIKEKGPSLISRRQHHAFRMYLLALWCCYPHGGPRIPPHLENKHLAVLLDLGVRPDSARSSAGHVIAFLEQERLLRRTRQGRQRSLIVGHESGDGRDYTRPKGGGPNAYVELPGHFFVNDWLNRLSAPAILVLLIALREERFMSYRKSKEKGWDETFDWFQPVSHLAKHYRLGKTTIEKGLRELRNCGFLTSRLTARHPRKKSLVAPRNLYSNHADVFSSTIQ